MRESNKKEKIKAAVAIAIILTAILTAIIITITYQIEGEKDMPFKLSKVTIISTAEGVEMQKEEGAEWNLDIYQNNDIYFYFEKNNKEEDEEVSNEIIKSIILENLKITKAPEVGEIKIYMPNSTEGRTFIYSDNLLVEEKLEYKGGTRNDLKTLQIGNQGGSLAIRISNTNFAKYIPKEGEEITHDGTIISKTDIQKEQLEFEISMDVIVNTRNKSYKSTIKLKLPCGNIIEEGRSSIENTNQKEFIFKRN